MKQENELTGIVLASGEGSRLQEVSQKLGLPKHLFPLGEESLIERTLKNMAPHCQQLVCITQKQFVSLFEEKLKHLPFEVQIVAKEKDGFIGDLEKARQMAQSSHILLTVGDLVFPSSAISEFIQRINIKKINLGLDRSAINFPKQMDLRIALVSFPKEMIELFLHINPEKHSQIIPRALKLLIQGKITVKWTRTLFNINTPDSYSEAQSFFNETRQ